MTNKDATVQSRVTSRVTTAAKIARLICPSSGKSVIARRAVVAGRVFRKVVAECRTAVMCDKMHTNKLQAIALLR
jgi:hypothetical protein